MIDVKTLRQLVIATGNRNKFVEFQKLLAPLGITLLMGKDLCPNLEVEETGETFLENARLKAQAWCERTNLPALADDSGIEVAALGGRPGVRSARYAPTDAECRAKLLGELAGVADRSARFAAALVLCWPDGSEWSTLRYCDGSVTEQELGERGFGYDSLFLPLGETKTFAQMTMEEKDAVSHRGKATRQLFLALGGKCDTIKS